MTISADIQKLNPGAKIELFELDASAFGGEQLYFHNHTKYGPIIWKGVTYSLWPVELTGLERTSDQQPTPKLTAANVNGVLGSMCLAYDDLIGAKVYRRRTLMQYLDAANFTDGNATADPDEEFPTEAWIIDSKDSESPSTVAWNLVSPLDFGGQQLPARQVIKNYCNWIKCGGYRGIYCGYTGTNYYDRKGNAVTTLGEDKCGGRLSDCKLRFGENASLPYGGFSSAGKTS